MLVAEFGIDAGRVETEGKGETQPIADNKTKEGKAANRRVEFTRN
jgi:outer membrane protein OmpA-like peptidoglycan-associated protein